MINKKDFILNLLILTAGSLITAVGVYFFKIPYKFSMGGMSGLSIILNELFPKIDTSTFILLFNVVFLALGFIFVGKGLGWKTTYCSLLYTGVVQVLQWVFPDYLGKDIQIERILALFFACVIPAIGTAVVFKYGGSTGGTDIIALILRKYVKTDISSSMMSADIIVVALTFFIIGIDTGLYALLGMIMKSFVIQFVLDKMNRRKTLIVITTKPDEIRDFIITKMKRGATIWNAEGAFTDTEKSVVFTAMTTYQAAKLREYTKRTDEHAFVTMLNTSEIYGKGFMPIND